MVGKILIVDDVATNRIVFKVKLGAACYQPLLAGDGATCLKLAREAGPDLILLDLMLPDMNGIDVLRRLRADAVTRDIPVVVFSASPDPEAKMQALLAGADDFLCKPIDDQILLARLRNLLRAREAVAEMGYRDATLAALGLAEGAVVFDGPGLVALVAARADTALHWRKGLSGVLPDRLVVLSREEALAETFQAPAAAAPDVFVIEAGLGGAGGGLRLMSDLRSRSATRHAAVCIVSPPAGADNAAMAFDLGANDLVEADFNPRELAVRLRGLLRRKRLTDRLRASVQDGLRLAVIDPLTGLYNRRYAIPHLAAIAEAGQAAGSDFAVMVIDLDRFKSVNDRFGHAAGDAVLVEVARRLSDNLRAGDLLARIGGEEFLVALPRTGLSDARTTAERLCRVVQERPVALSGGRALSVTVSIGLAIGNPGRPLRLEPVGAVMERADRALLTAKAEGRNQVTVSRSAA